MNAGGVNFMINNRVYDNRTADARADSLDPVVMPHDLMTKGGKWLGAAREWLQSNRINGDTVFWGSHDILRPAFTVLDVELMAAHIASAAINEERERVRRNDPDQRPGEQPKS
jgi:hypothetical protein